MYSNKKWLLISAMLLVAALVLGACGQTVVTVTVPVTSEGGGPGVEPTEPPSDGGTGELTVFKVGLLADMTTTNYWNYLDQESSVWNQYVLAPLYPSLMGLSDQRFDWVPAIADGLPGERTTEGDFVTITVKIKPGLTWSDGSPLTAKDAAFTVNTSLKMRLAGNWAGTYDPTVLDHVEAVDDVTVKYFFNGTPGLAQWEYGASIGPILPESYWGPIVEAALPGVEALTEPAADAPQEDQDAYATALLEAQQALYQHVPENTPFFGPMLFDKWEAGAFAQSNARDDYFFKGANVKEYADGGYEETKEGAYTYSSGDLTGDVTLDLTVGPYVPSIVYSVYDSADAAVLALANGEIDYIFNPLAYSGGLRAQISTIPNVVANSNPSNGWRYMAFNLTHEPLDNIAFRQAMATLIDREYICNTILQGVVLPAFSPVPPGNAFWYNPDTPRFGYNDDGTPMDRATRINKAIELLEAAGFSFEGGVKPALTGEGARDQQVTTGGALLMPNGAKVPTLTMLHPTAGYDPTRATAGLLIAGWFNEFGIPTTAKATAFNTILDVVFDPSRLAEWDMYILGYGLTAYPSYLRDFLNSEGGGILSYGYSNPEMDQLTNDFVAATDLGKARDLAFQIQALNGSEVSLLILFSNPVVDVFRTNVEFPYTSTLDGLQAVLALPGTVKVFKASE